jgi:hypothetical protein
MQKKKRKKKRGYHRGLYVSPIAGECKFRSSWEEKYMKYLDSNVEVSKWSYESFFIEYLSNKSTGKTRKYYPDFLVEMKDGSKFVVEIKQKRKLEQLIVRKKTKAAEEWCVTHGATYKLLTEIELRQLGIL